MKVLHIAHGHPDFQAGGTELFAQALARHQASVGWQTQFLAAAPPRYRQINGGTALITPPSEAADFVMTGGDFDLLALSQKNFGFLAEFERVLSDLRPDVVHFHHLLMFGIEAIAVARRVLPAAKLVLTLHDYYALCANEGSLKRTDGTLCARSTPGRCLQCRPDATLVALRLRDLTIRAAFELIDQFVAPSAFLAAQLRGWGLPTARLRVIQNGHPASAAVPRPAPPQPTPDRPLRIGFFGNVVERKGVPVLLQGLAAAIARGAAPVSVQIHGSTQFAPSSLQSAIAADVERLGPHVQIAGTYAPDDVYRRIAGVDWVAVPSIWYENDPLVIQEAFHCRRPVLCSGIGGMAERVIDGVYGHHVAPGDPAAWADAILALAADPSRATTIGAQVPAAHSMATCADAYQEAYTAP